MPAQIEQIVDSSVGSQKSLCLIGGLKPPHAVLPDSRWLMREFRPIVGVLGGVVDRIRDKLSMSDTVAPQLVCDDSSRFFATR